MIERNFFFFRQTIVTFKRPQHIHSFIHLFWYRCVEKWFQSNYYNSSFSSFLFPLPFYASSSYNTCRRAYRHFDRFVLIVNVTLSLSLSFTHHLPSIFFHLTILGAKFLIVCFKRQPFLPIRSLKHKWLMIEVEKKSGIISFNHFNNDQIWFHWKKKDRH